MAVDLYASDPAFGFAGKRQARNLDELIAWTRAQLRLGADRPWRVISSRMKLAKTLFEVEENGRRLIGKVSRSERASHTYERMRMLWDAGMRPPSECVIPEPVAWLPERHLLLQARAEGRQVLDSIQKSSETAENDAALAAAWLRAVRSLHLPKLGPAEDLVPVLERCRSELREAAPELRARIDRIAAAIQEALPYRGPLVAGHGDYHPMNIYIGDEGTVTAIDLDTVAMREPAFDVAWFIAQAAIMGHHLHGSFSQTRTLRDRFCDELPEDPERVRLHVRFALLRSMHYDLCILKLKDVPHLESFVRAAEAGAIA